MIWRGDKCGADEHVWVVYEEMCAMPGAVFLGVLVLHNVVQLATS